MDKKIAALLGAAAGASLFAPSSYAELLTPIPNAVEVLKADDAARSANVQLVDMYWDGYRWVWTEHSPFYRHHHHHHHNNYRWHDHHHHHNWYHHHHHHHHHGYWGGDRDD